MYSHLALAAGDQEDGQLEAREMISSARKLVILADVEVHRFGLQDEVLRFARKTNIPVAATVLGKSVIGEQHPFYLGYPEAPALDS